MDTTMNRIHAVAPETTRVESYEWVVIPSIVLLALTIVGALMILGSMAWLEYRGRPATTRTRLVQALVLSDLLLGIVGLIGNAMEITPGHHLVAGSATCDGLGFVLIAVLWTEHMWTLCLALGTYLILCHPLHNLTLILEKHWIWLWGLVWLMAIVVAIITQTVYGFMPSGGICYYPKSAGLYGELMQFIPRAIVFICITLIYARLYVFLKRPDKIRSPYSNSSVGGTYESSRPAKKVHGFLRKLSKGEKGTAAGAGVGEAKVTENNHGSGTPNLDVIPADPNSEKTPQTHSEPRFNRDNRPSIGLGSVGFGETTYRPPSAPVSPMSEIPPWERLELPVFQVDGQRYGGPSPGQGRADGMFGNWKGMNSKKRPSTANSTGSNPASQPMPFPPRGGSGQGQTTYTSGSGSRQEGSDGTGNGNGNGNGSRSRHPSSDTTLVGGDKDKTRKGSMMTTASATSSNNNSNLQSQVYTTSRRPSAIAPQASPVIETDDEGFRSRTNSDDSNTNSNEDRERAGEGEGEEEEEEDNEMDLLRMLRQDSEPEDQRTSKEEYELVPESMASYLNRKTALLMLWFPLGYVMLFSISLIRVIYDFAGEPPTVLRAMSRWFVFAQGVLDAIIYGLVEWHTKRVVRRRLRKGALTPGGSRGTASFGAGSVPGLSSALRSMNFRKSKNGSQSQSQTRSQSQSQSQSQIGTRSQTQSQGRGQMAIPIHQFSGMSSTGSGTGIGTGTPRQGRYPTIMQELELELDLDSPRKGSWATSEGNKEGSVVSDKKVGGI